MEKLSKIIKVLGYLDYAVSVSVLGYGTYTGSWLYIAAGIFGVGIAYLKPAERLKTKLQAKFIRKQVLSGVPAAEEAAIPQVAPTPFTASTAYLPRSRYTATRYFLNYYAPQATRRGRVLNPRDTVAVLYAPKSRSSLGVRATSVRPRQPRSAPPAQA